MPTDAIENWPRCRSGLHILYITVLASFKFYNLLPPPPFMSNLQPKKPKIWANGPKEEFLKRQLPDYRKAQELEKVGDFYTATTRLWIQKFGWHFDPYQTVAEDSPDPLPASVADLSISDEEQRIRQRYFLDMRLVSASIIWVNNPYSQISLVRQKVVYWYNRHNAAMGKKSQTSLARAFEEMVLSNRPPKPHRARATHYYSKYYYDDRVKLFFDIAYKKACNEAELQGVDPPPIIKVRNEVTAERWKNEPADFKATIAQRIEDEYAQAVKKWESEHAVKADPEPGRESLQVFHAIY